LVGRGRAAALDAVANAPEGWLVQVGPVTRNSQQNRLMHDLIGQIAKAKPTWNGLDMDADDWKHLLVASHAKATRDAPIRLVPCLDGDGLVQLVERTSRMNKSRAASFITYIEAWAATNGITLKRYDDQA